MWHKPGCVYLAAVQSSEQTSRFCQVMGGMYCKLTVNSLSVFMCGHSFSGLAGWGYINCWIFWGCYTIFVMDENVSRNSQMC